MKFQKALKEAIIKNRDSAKRLDEALLSVILRDWPKLVAHQYNVTNLPTTPEYEPMRAASQKALDDSFKDIKLENGSFWTGDFKTDVLVKINNQTYAYPPTEAKIDNENKSIYVSWAKKWVNYVTDPEAKLLYKRIMEVGAAQTPQKTPSPAPQGAVAPAIQGDRLQTMANATANPTV
jgi:hypothetical protein